MAMLATTSGDVCVFFFSSRRRHTRFDCDWSSDVCSSDLVCSAPRYRTSVSRCCLADGVGAAKQHLETDVRYLGAEQTQTVPWILAEEPHRRVECRAAPHFQREQLGHAMG